MRKKNAKIGVWPVFVDLLAALSLILMILFVAQNEKFKRLHKDLKSLEEAAFEINKLKKEIDRLKEIISMKDQKIISLENEIIELKKEKGINLAIVTEFEEELKKNNIKASIDSQKNIEIDASTLFETDRFDIVPEARENALRIGKVVYDLLRKKEKSAYISTVLVLGHTDHVGKDNENMNLSVKRASAFVNLWGSELENDKCIRGKIIASGIGSWRPKVNIADRSVGVPENRRIEIRIVPKSQAAKELKDCP
jgi:outer membrane protein OmpA-like peptidoglycan-associated protein